MTSQSVLPPNAVTPERALEACYLTSSICLAIFELLRIPICVLQICCRGFAWEYAVTTGTHPDWSEQQKTRNYLKKAAAWQNKHRGTRGAVEERY